MSMAYDKNTNQVNDDTLFSSFLKSIVAGDEDRVMAILEGVNTSDLERLLLHKGIVTDFSGRSIEGTGLQIALGAEDAEICEIMVPFFKRIPHGTDHQLQQYNIQYPANDTTSNTTQDMQAIEKVFASIISAKSVDECEPALTEFRNYFTPVSVIRKGRHFDVMLLVKAYKMYGKNYIQLGDWNSNMNNLCWTNVIGYLQRQLPACYAQAFCQGLVSIVVNKQLLQRSFHFLEADYELFPLDQKPDFRLGYHYAGGQWGLWDGKSSAERATSSAESLEIYIEQKQQRLAAIGKV